MFLDILPNNTNDNDVIRSAREDLENRYANASIFNVLQHIFFSKLREHRLQLDKWHSIKRTVFLVVKGTWIFYWIHWDSIQAIFSLTLNVDFWSALLWKCTWRFWKLKLNVTKSNFLINLIVQQNCNSWNILQEKVYVYRAFPDQYVDLDLLLYYYKKLLLRLLKFID